MVRVEDNDGKILREDDDNKKRWKEYFDRLLNTRNQMKELENLDLVWSIEEVTEQEVERYLGTLRDERQ